VQFGILTVIQENCKSLFILNKLIYIKILFNAKAAFWQLFAIFAFVLVPYMYIQANKFFPAISTWHQLLFKKNTLNLLKPKK
jgi:hypothetical protein